MQCQHQKNTDSRSLRHFRSWCSQFWTILGQEKKSKNVNKHGQKQCFVFCGSEFLRIVTPANSEGKLCSAFVRFVYTNIFISISENTGKLHVTNMKVPDPFIFGSSTDLYCNYTWDRTDLVKSPRKIYSIKWYKENLEFFR